MAQSSKQASRMARMLRKTKATKTSVDHSNQGYPRRNEGVPGNLQLRSTPDGLELSCQGSCGQWYSTTLHKIKDTTRVSKDLDVNNKIKVKGREVITEKANWVGAVVPRAYTEAQITEVLVSGSGLGRTHDAGEITVTITPNTVAQNIGADQILLTSLANLTASRALVSDGSGTILHSATTSTEIGYLDITTLGTAAASKALTTDASNVLTAPSGFEMKVESGGIITIEDGGKIQSDELYDESGNSKVVLGGASGSTSVALSHGDTINVVQKTKAKANDVVVSCRKINSDGLTGQDLIFGNQMQAGSVLAKETMRSIGGLGPLAEGTGYDPYIEITSSLAINSTGGEISSTAQPGGSGTAVTVTTDESHGLSNGNVVYLTRCSDADLSGEYTIANASSAVFDVTPSGDVEESSTGYWQKKTDLVKVTSINDDDTMASDSNTALVTQQSIKAYVDKYAFSINAHSYARANNATWYIFMGDQVAAIGGTTNVIGGTQTITLTRAKIDALWFICPHNITITTVSGSVADDDMTAHIDKRIGIWTVPSLGTLGTDPGDVGGSLTWTLRWKTDDFGGTSGGNYIQAFYDVGADFDLTKGDGVFLSYMNVHSGGLDDVTLNCTLIGGLTT